MPTAKLLCCYLLLLPLPLRASDLLPSWRDSATKRDIVAFVASVSDPNSPHYVPPQARLAAFDMDGTLWPEKPNYFPVLFAIARVRGLAAAHPQWRDEEPFARVLQAGVDAELSHDDMMVLQEVAFGASTPQQFARWVQDWLKERHPTLRKPFASLAYVPMQQLVALLRTHGFTVALDSGAEAEFLRGVSQTMYAVPPFWVIGNHLQMRYQMRDGRPWLQRLKAWQDPFNGGAGKVINLVRTMGTMPIFAAGNADNDLELLQSTQRAAGPHFSLLICHDDAQREFAYVEGAQQVRAMAADEGTHLVSVRDDFLTVFANQVGP